MTKEEKPVKLQVSPDSFYGRSDEDGKLHIQQFEMVAKCNNWDSSVMMKYLPITLKGISALWYSNWLVSKPADKQTWDELIKDFKEAFSASAHLNMAEHKLNNRKQKLGETTQAFVYEMIELCRAVDPAMQESTIVGKIIRNLLPNYLQPVNLMDPKNITHLLEALKKVEETQYLIKNQNESQFFLMTEAAKVNASSKNEMAEVLGKMQELMVQNTKLMQSMANTQQQQKRVHFNLACEICGYNNHETRNCRRRNNPPRDINQRNWNQGRNNNSQWNQPNQNQGGNRNYFQPRNQGAQQWNQGNGGDRNTSGPRNPGNAMNGPVMPTPPQNHN